MSRRSEAPAKLGSEVGATQSEPDAKNSHALSHTRLLGAGLVVLMLADFMLAWSNHWTWAWAGITLWGVHMAMTQGLLASMVAGTAPADLRGTAFGVFNLVSGVAMLFASVLAGLLWDRFGAASTFIAGAAIAGLALLLLLLRERVGRTGD